jgi:hypothetical protein
MRKIFLSSILFSVAVTAFSQQPKENGKIFITHPYIDAVNKATESYLAQDMKANAVYYSDTAKVWVSGMDKSIPIAEAMKLFASDFEFYKDIKLTPVGYPDFLHYVDKDQQWVQSWWTWSGVSKKTGETVKIDCVQFDKFNQDGKITNESIYGDFSKMVKEK